MASTSTSLPVDSRSAQSSREARRQRRLGRVPGIVYGGGDEPVAFSADERTLRYALAGSGAVLDLAIDGATAQPVVVKDTQRHPVRGHLMHVDLIRVNLREKIQSIVPLELVGADEAEVVRLGATVEHLLREVTVEALPTEIPESITLDITNAEEGETLTLARATVPPSVVIVDDLELDVVNLRMPRTRINEDGEVEVIVEGGASEAEIAEVEAGGAEAGADADAPAEDAPAEDGGGQVEGGSDES